MVRFCFAGCLFFAAVGAGAQTTPNPAGNATQATQSAQMAEAAESAALNPAPPTFAPDTPNAQASKTRGPVRISGGVMAGNVRSKVDPVYPPEAKANGLQGSVILDAHIGKTGAVQHLRVVSGPPALATAALDAVRQWTYKPMLLDGQATDVLTTVTVNFQLAPPAPQQ